MFLVVLLCIKLSISYKKFSFFMLSREEKDKCVEVYICKHVSVFSLYYMWSIYTCMYGVVCVSSRVKYIYICISV